MPTLLLAVILIAAASIAVLIRDARLEARARRRCTLRNPPPVAHLHHSCPLA